VRVKVNTVTAKDCEWTYFRGSGPGGQKKNKTASGVRVVHPPSGAVGRATDTRSQRQNRKLAWKRMAQTPEFLRWAKGQAGIAELIESNIEKAMAPDKLKVEVKEEGKWKTIPSTGGA